MLAAGAVRALTGWRNTTVAPNHSLLFTKAVAVLAAHSDWSRCGSNDQCDYCEAGKTEHCHYITSPRRLLRGAVYTAHVTLPIENAGAYLTGDAKGPLTGKSGWARAHHAAPDAADGFVVTLARDLRQHGRTDLARPAVEKLWRTRTRTPRLTIVYAAIVEADKRPATNPPCSDRPQPSARTVSPPLHPTTPMRGRKLRHDSPDSEGTSTPPRESLPPRRTTRGPPTAPGS